MLLLLAAGGAAPPPPKSPAMFTKLTQRRPVHCYHSEQVTCGVPSVKHPEGAVDCNQGECRRSNTDKEKQTKASRLFLLAAASTELKAASNNNKRNTRENELPMYNQTHARAYSRQGQRRGLEPNGYGAKKKGARFSRRRKPNESELPKRQSASQRSKVNH